MEETRCLSDGYSSDDSAGVNPRLANVYRSLGPRVQESKARNDRETVKAEAGHNGIT